MASITEPHDNLSEQELARLEALENELARGTSVRWDEPKRISGFLVRPIEKVTVKDYSDPSKTVEKQVATLRTANGLQTIWEGPAGLEKLFEVQGSGMPVIVDYKGEKVAQESGRSYKSFDVIVGPHEAALPAAEEAILDDLVDEHSSADDDIPF
jgi:hypothetical protein